MKVMCAIWPICLTTWPSTADVTKELHRLIDNGAEQSVINERIAGLIERSDSNLARVEALVEKITSDHERRLRYLERSVAWALGASAIIYIVWQLVTRRASNE